MPSNNFTVSHAFQGPSATPSFESSTDSPLNLSVDSNSSLDSCRSTGSQGPLSPRTDLVGGMSAQREHAAYEMKLKAHSARMREFESTKATRHTHMCMVKCVLGEAQRYQRELPDARRLYDLESKGNRATYKDQCDSLLKTYFGGDENVTTAVAVESQDGSQQTVEAVVLLDGYVDALKATRNLNLFQSAKSSRAVVV